MKGDLDVSGGEVAKDAGQAAEVREELQTVDPESGKMVDASQKASVVLLCGGKRTNWNLNGVRVALDVELVV